MRPLTLRSEIQGAQLTCYLDYFRKGSAGVLVSSELAPGPGYADST